MLRQKFATVLIISAVVVLASSAFATPNFSLGPTPKYAKRVEDLPPGLYVVIYPQRSESPIPGPRRRGNNEGNKPFYTLILTLMKVDFSDDALEPFLAPFLAEVEVQNVEWKKEREGMKVREQLLEIAGGPKRTIIYFHPKADELYKDYCIYRLINTDARERCN